MRENVTLNADTRWSVEAVMKLQDLWRSGVPLDIIAHTLGRPAAEVRAKAVELKLGVHGGSAAAN